MMDVYFITWQGVVMHAALLAAFAIIARKISRRFDDEDEK